MEHGRAVTHIARAFLVIFEHYLRKQIQWGHLVN